MNEPQQRRSDRLAAKSAAPGTTANDTIMHDAYTRRFYNADNVQAFLEYVRDGESINLLHTEVPIELEGRGLGKQLAKTALEYVAANDLRLEIGCDFIRHFVKKYEPQYLKYTEKGASL